MTKKLKKKYAIYDKLGASAVASILMDKYDLKLYFNRETEMYCIFYNGGKYEAFSLGELMYFIEVFYPKCEKNI